MHKIPVEAPTQVPVDPRERIAAYHETYASDHPLAFVESTVWTAGVYADRFAENNGCAVSHGDVLRELMESEEYTAFTEGHRPPYAILVKNDQIARATASAFGGQSPIDIGTYKLMIGHRPDLPEDDWTPDRGRMMHTLNLMDTAAESDLDPTLQAVVTVVKAAAESKSLMLEKLSPFMDLLPGSDFPLLQLKTTEQQRAFWHRQIFGRFNRAEQVYDPGLLRLALNTSRLRNASLNKLKEVVDEQDAEPLLSTIEAVVYMRTSELKNVKTKDVRMKLLNAIATKDLDVIQAAFEDVMVDQPLVFTPATYKELGFTEEDREDFVRLNAELSAATTAEQQEQRKAEIAAAAGFLASLYTHGAAEDLMATYGGMIFYDERTRRNRLLLPELIDTPDDSGHTYTAEPGTGVSTRGVQLDAEGNIIGVSPTVGTMTAGSVLRGAFSGRNVFREDITPEQAAASYERAKTTYVKL